MPAWTMHVRALARAVDEVHASHYSSSTVHPLHHLPLQANDEQLQPGQHNRLRACRRLRPYVKATVLASGLATMGDPDHR